MLNLRALILDSGIVYWGGLLGFIITAVLICNKQEKNINKLSNILAVAIPLFHGFGRIGCFFAGCCYGRENNGFFALPYRIGYEGEWTRRYPTQLAEAIVEFLLFGILLTLYIKRKNGRKIPLLDVYLLAYSLFRFVAEYFRGDAERGIVCGISFGQFICMAVLIYLAVKYYKRMKGSNKE